MSVPVSVGVVAAVLALGVPVITAAVRAEAGHRALGTADAAALAAADASIGFLDGEPCAAAEQVARAADARLSECETDRDGFEVRVVIETAAPFGSVVGRARAGAQPNAAAPVGSGPIGANGWAWPSAVRAVTQGSHDGHAIDLAVDASGVLYAPYRGIVVRVGDDGHGIPAECRARPDWWHGPNQTVLIRHEYLGRTLYSSHNHLVAGSSARAGIGVGTAVSAGQPVGAAGRSGCTSGPHSHFTLASAPRNTNPDLDPYLYIGSP